jgi:hypothetical protein
VIVAVAFPETHGRELEELTGDPAIVVGPATVTVPIPA